MTANPHVDAAARQRWEEGYLGTRRQLWLRRLRIRRFLRLPRGRRIVEIGSGDGLNLQVLAALGHRRLVGLEYSLDLLLRSPARPQAAGDAHALPFADGSVDAVFVDSVLHHLIDYQAAAREIARVLAPGGRLVYFEPRPSLWRRLFDRATFGAPGRRIAWLAARRQTLLEEIDLYGRWLREHAAMERHLRESGLAPRFYRRGPIGMFVGFDKPGDG